MRSAMGRSQVTVRLDDARIAEIDREASDRDMTRADVIREALDIRSEYADLQREVERLRDELRATNARQDDVGELVEYVEEERAIREHEQRRQQASVLTRAKWWFTGMPKKD